MKISSYMRKKINFRGHRQSGMKKNEESKHSISEKEELPEVTTIEHRGWFSSSNITHGFPFETKQDLNNTFVHQKKKNVKFFKNRKFLRNRNMNKNNK